MTWSPQGLLRVRERFIALCVAEVDGWDRQRRDWSCPDPDCRDLSRAGLGWAAQTPG
jgi:hypothetical protein